LNLRNDLRTEAKKVKASSLMFSFISEATTMKASAAMPGHGGARNKAGRSKKSEQPAHDEGDSDDESDVSEKDITCFNREWWRRRCQMFTPAPTNASHIRLLHEYITDEGGSADLTFKIGRKVIAPKRAGKLLTASLTKNVLKGKIELSCFTFTQGNAETPPLVEAYRKVRINRGTNRVENYHQKMSLVLGVTSTTLVTRGYTDQIQSHILNIFELRYIRTQLLAKACSSWRQRSMDTIKLEDVV
jgi:hypothetical protein